MRRPSRRCERDGRRRRALASYLVASAAALAAPLAFYAGLVTFRLAGAERSALERTAEDAAREVAVALEREAALRTATLAALATAPALAAPGPLPPDVLPRLRERAAALLPAGEARVVLRERDGRVVQDAPHDAPHDAPVALGAAERAVLASGRPALSDPDLEADPDADPAVIVPVTHGGAVVRLLSASLPRARLTRIARERNLSEDYFVSIADRGGTILARSRGDVGGDAGAAPRRLVGYDAFKDAAGRWTGRNVDGVPIVAFYRHSPTTGYIVAIGIVRGALEAPLRRLLAELAVLALALVGLGALGARAINRSIAEAVGDLTRLADGLGRGDGTGADGAVRRVRVREFAAIAVALRRGTRALRTRDEALERARRDLEARVEERTRALAEQGLRLTATLDAMDQGLFMIEADGRVPVFNRRVAELLDLDPVRLAGAPHFGEIRGPMIARGEYDGVDAGFRRWLERGELEADAAYERVRPNGTVLEVRSTTMPGGGVVRTYTDITERKRTEARVLASEARLRALADGLPQMVWVMRAEDGVETYRNASFEAYYGPIGSGRHERVRRNHPDDAERVAREWRRARERGEALQVEVRVLRRDGAYRWHRLVVIPTRGVDGTVAEWLGTALDIDDIVAARDALARTGDLLRLAQEAAGAGIWDWDAARRVLRLSRESLAMHGFPEAATAGDDGVEISNADWATRIHPDDADTVWSNLRGAMRERRTFTAEYRVARDARSGAGPGTGGPAEAGGWRWIQAFGRLVHDEREGRVTRVVGLTLEITARKEAEQRVAHVARHDALTDLPNRVTFRERLDQTLAAARRGEAGDPGGDRGRDLGSGHASCAVLCLDLDRFKAVNDTLGHPAGDRLLAEVARRLRAALRPEDVVARLGGDEFAIIQVAPGEGRPRAAAALAGRLIEAVSQPIVVDGRSLAVGLSVGIALAPAGETDGDSVFKRADMALYRAKAEGRNTYRFYEAAMDEAVEARRQLELDLRGALQRAEFELHYQPIVAVADGRVTGFEALVRWRHPERGLVSPAEFIPLAEETGLIVPIGGWVLRTALRDAEAWPSNGVEALRVAVNVSAVQFRQAGFLRGLVAALAASGLPAERLELEVTETVLMGDGTDVLALLEGVRGLGVRIALDDFGTGYSSLSYLRRFPFDKIKIDRSFVADLASRADAVAIVRAIVGLGARLGMSITAEGVETPEQLALLRAEGCTEAQGYLFSPPRSAEETVAALARETDAAA